MRLPPEHGAMQAHEDGMSFKNQKSTLTPLMRQKLLQKRNHMSEQNGTRPSSPSAPNSPQNSMRPKATPNSLLNDSKPSNTSDNPQRRQKNINDPSYRETTPAPTRFKGRQPGGTIGEQMREANQDLGQTERSHRQVDERKSARQRMQDKHKLTVRQEHGSTDAFSRGSQVQHRLDPKTRAVGQETGRLTQATLNPRPGLRVHPKAK